MRAVQYVNVVCLIAVCAFVVLVIDWFYPAWALSDPAHPRAGAEAHLGAGYRVVQDLARHRLRGGCVQPAGSLPVSVKWPMYCIIRLGGTNTGICGVSVGEEFTTLLSHR